MVLTYIIHDSIESVSAFRRRCTVPVYELSGPVCSFVQMLACSCRCIDLPQHPMPIFHSTPSVKHALPSFDGHWRLKGANGSLSWCGPTPSQLRHLQPRKPSAALKSSPAPSPLSRLTRWLRLVTCQRRASAEVRQARYEELVAKGQQVRGSWGWEGGLERVLLLFLNFWVGGTLQV